MPDKNVKKPETVDQFIARKISMARGGYQPQEVKELMIQAYYQGYSFAMARVKRLIEELD